MDSTTNIVYEEGVDERGWRVPEESQTLYTTKTYARCTSYRGWCQSLKM
jgi:hypothetical protein